MPAPSLTVVATEATEALHRLVGREADFRPGQLEAIEALVAERRRVLVVQRTGWGKSAVYIVATALLRAAGAGPTVIVSPLLALMRDQVAAAERAGIRAVTMNSANAEDWADVARALAADEVDLLLVSPERLNNPRFREEQLPGLARRCGLLVVDEAHCVSDWGHDFRPDYRRIRDLLTTLPADTPVLATTATANARVVTDVAEQLGAGGHDVLTLRGGLARDSLRLGVLPLGAPEQRLAWLVAHLGDLPGSGIVYTLTVAGADDVASALRRAGHDVASYTGRTDPADRLRLEEALRDNGIKALVATSALGMGFDKPDLGFVIHLGAPSSPVAYYQQVGRAGRATERADVLLLPGPEDRDIWRYFASASMPRQEQADAVLTALAESGRRVVHARAGGRRRHPPHPPRAAAQGPRRRRRGRQGHRRLGVHRGAVGVRHRAVCAGRRRARPRAGADARLRARRRLPDGVPPAGARRRDRSPVRAVRPMRRPVVRVDPPAGRRQRRPRTAGSGGCRDRAARPVADGDVAAGRPGVRPDRRRRGDAARAGGRETHRPRLGTAAAWRLRGGRSRVRGPAPGVRGGAARLGLGRAAGRGRGDAVARAARAGRLGGAGDRLDRAAAVPRHARPRRGRPDR